MGRGRWASVLMALAVLLAVSRPVSAEQLTSAQMIARADAIVEKAQRLYDKVLAKLQEVRAANDPSVIADANNLLTTVKGILKKAERDRSALKEALARSTRDTWEVP